MSILLQVALPNNNGCPSFSDNDACFRLDSCFCLIDMACLILDLVGAESLCLLMCFT